MFNGVDKIPACDGQTDRRTNILRRHSPRCAYASRGKNCYQAIQNIQHTDVTQTQSDCNFNFHTRALRHVRSLLTDDVAQSQTVACVTKFCVE